MCLDVFGCVWAYLDEAIHRPSLHCYVQQAQDVDVSRLLQDPVVPAAWMEAQLQRQLCVPLTEDGIDWQAFGAAH
jgi:hypothetical protein